MTVSLIVCVLWSYVLQNVSDVSIDLVGSIASNGDQDLVLKR